MSLTAKVRPARARRAAGGGGCGEGASSKRSTKAPKLSTGLDSSLRIHRRRLRRVASARTTTPATVIPTTIHTLGLETSILPNLKCFDRSSLKLLMEKEKRGGVVRV